MYPHFFLLGGGGGQWYVCATPTHTHTLLTPHFYFPLELYVYLTLTNNDLAFYHIIPINYLVDNFNKLTQMAVIK